MRRPVLLPLLLVVLGGCVVRTVAPMPPPEPMPPPAAPMSVAYYGEHALPGGGWCYIDGPHQHDFYPERADLYAVDGGVYYWRGPVMVTYYAGHPLPGGGWCYIEGPHVHDYAPPRDSGWYFRPGRGYLYRGPYSAARPAPTAYWARPAQPRFYQPRPGYAPAPAYGAPAPAPAYAPRPAPASAYAPAPAPAYAPRPGPAPAPAPAYAPRPGASAYAPGHGNVPPGHGGTPPGQAKKQDADRRDKGGKQDKHDQRAAPRRGNEER